MALEIENISQAGVRYLSEALMIGDLAREAAVSCSAMAAR